MAEVAGAAIVAEQLVATAVEAGAAVAAVAVPTQPLKGTLRKIGATTPNDTSLTLARAHHTVAVIGDKAYLFGGQASDDELCSNDIHAFTLPGGNNQADYACYPAFPLKDAAGEAYAPAARTRHAASVRGSQLVIHGGRDAKGDFVEDGLTLWLWDSEHLKWTRSKPDIELYKTLPPRSDHHIFVDERQDLLVLHGGNTTPDRTAPAGKETWLYDFSTNAWTTMPPSPAPALSAAYAGETLYTISGDSGLGGAVHYLKLQPNEEERAKRNALVWQTVEFPSNPLVPGPVPRAGAAFVPVTTGMGRLYLIYMLGKKAEGGAVAATTDHGSYPFFSDIWSLQLPTAGLNPASIKDTIREKLAGRESGALTWAEVQLDAPDETAAEEDRHPGPRAFTAAATAFSGKGAVLWGGLNPKGKAQSDGWALLLR